MKELNPIEKVEYIKEEFKKYISSTYYLENDAWIGTRFIFKKN